MQRQLQRGGACWGALVSALVLAAALAPLSAAAATKILYVHDDQALNRTPQAADTVTPVTVAGGGGYQDWTMSPAIPTGKSLSLTAGNVDVDLVIEGTGAQPDNDRPLRLELRDSAGNVLGNDAFTFTNNNQTLMSRTIAISATTLNAGDYLVLRVYNDEATTGGTPLPARTISVSQQVTGKGSSELSFDTSTVISVDSVAVYSAAWSATTTQPLYDDGETAYLRVVVSDPFGSGDISGASMTLTDAASAVVFSGQSLASYQVASDAASRTYEYPYLLQTGSADGAWTVDVTATEGSEGTVTDTGSVNFSVGVPQLAVAKSHTGDFPAGGNGSYSIVVHNNGIALTGTTTVTDTLDNDLHYASASGTGWSCSSNAPTVPETVTCTNGASLANGADLATLTLNVTVDGDAGTSIANHATVSHPSVNGGAGQDGNTDVVGIDHPDLSGSDKDVADTNGGDTDNGDTLRYTITLAESAGTAATGVSVTDTIPALVAFGGSIDGSSTCSGTDGSTSGQVSVTGITVPASGSCTIVFDVTVGGAVAGDTIDNSASIASPNGNDPTVTARTVTVLESQAAASGNKVLYVYDNGDLTRTPQSSDTVTPVAIAGNGATADWQLTPAIPTGKSLTLSAGTITAYLVMSAYNTGFNNARPVVVELRSSSGNIATSGTVQVQYAAVDQYTFTMSLGSPVTLNAGDYLVLRVRNDENSLGRQVAVYQKDSSLSGQDHSTVSFATSTVVNVDGIAIYAAAWPSTTTQPSYQQGDTVYVRATISDPFGSADVGGADLAMSDVDATVQLSGAAMTQVDDDGVATRTYERAYTLPGNAEIGFWTASATGKEGTEGTVTHTANVAFGVGVSTLSVNKMHSGSFVAGTNGSYSIVVHNNSPGDVTGTTTVTDTLDGDLSYVSGTGTGWTCSSNAPTLPEVVTCTSTDQIDAGTSLPTITLTVAVDGAADNAVDNMASVANTTVDGGSAQPGNVDPATILHPDLSGSTKDVVDPNGGDADPGDTLRYTITLVESAGAAASGISVTDTTPTHTSFGGSIDGASTCSGTDGSTSGQVSVTGISLAASASCTIVFDVTVTGVAGDHVDNTATIANPNGTGATPAAHTVVVSQSQVAASGNKLLYPYDDQSLTRVVTSANTVTPVDIAGGGGNFADWQLAPAVATGKSLVLDAGDITATLVIAASNTAPGTGRPVTVELLNGSTTIATSASSSVSGSSVTDTNAYSFTITVPQTTLAAGDVLVMRVHNNSGTAGRHIAIYQKTAADGLSTLSLDTSTVINVDSAAVYSAAYPAVTTQAYYVHGQSAYVRAVVSDPFGSADVNHATITLTDPGGTIRVNAAAMTQLVDSGAATKTYGYGYQVPVGAKLGTWTASITAYEGTEGAVTHTGNTSFEVRGHISLAKAWSGANAGDAVDLAITGGSDAVAGSSTAPSTTTAATAAGTASATITLAESFTTGLASNYSPSLACTRDADAVAIPISGTGLGRTITMPLDSSVTCTWTNQKTVPLTVVKLSTVYSDPVNGTTYPKAIPGAVVEYQVIITNPASNPVDADTLFLRDALPPEVLLRVADLGGSGSGPVSFTNGSPASGMTYTFTALGNAGDDLQFSNDSGATWTYVPTPDVDGFDTAVTDLRVNPKGYFSANNAQFTLKYRVRIR